MGIWEGGRVNLSMKESVMEAAVRRSQEALATVREQESRQALHLEQNLAMYS